ncbi:MAG: sugar phosphate isomerase/epimerase [Clostridia bacterium]|nr:sugar phosphate isomerase/epimerase [Clostridia bacterium]
MKKNILCSTGTIVGRANGFDYRLILRYRNEICADGFELMMLKAYYGNLSKIAADLEQASVKIPLIHFEKDITALLGLGNEDDRREGLRIFEENVKMAQAVGAKGAVFHLWDGRFDKTHLNSGILLLETLYEICEKRGVELLVENVPCRISPYENILKIAEMYPNARFTFDTRHADFIGETARFTESPIWQTKIGHIHISDHCGQTVPGMWGVTRPILHPTEGNIDFSSLFASMPPYIGETVTLESPVMLPDGTHDLNKLNRSLSFIRKKINES